MSETTNTDANAQTTTPPVNQPATQPTSTTPAQAATQATTQATQAVSDNRHEPSLIAELQALPERVANAVREAMPQAPVVKAPPAQTQTTDSTQTATTETKSPQKKTFVGWWFGG
jgi:hypothetical protein